MEAQGRGSLDALSARPGAIIIGGDYQGLGIARSLGRQGIDIAVVDDEASIARHSRYVTESFRVRDLRSEEQTLEVLRGLARQGRFQGWVVYPTRDETVAALSRHRDELLEHFRIPTPRWEVTKWAWDKRNTYRRAAELGIPTPRSWVVASEDELDAIDGDPPYAIKPAIKERFIYATKDKAWRADSRDELARRFREAAELIGAGETVVQELIPGDGNAQLGYGGFFKDGHAIASMTVKRLRQHPREFGRSSTFVRTCELPEIRDLSERFLRSIDYYGLVDIDYKYDERDGLTKILDVNARTWSYHALGQRAGVDFASMLYADQVGVPLTQATHARPGVSWIRLATDVPMAVKELAGRRLDWRAYRRSLRRPDVESVFCRDDPAPAFAEIALLPYLAATRGL
jgi:predicted ATP-grasp superfamily ATP-dependent carboligase